MNIGTELARQLTLDRMLASLRERPVEPVEKQEAKPPMFSRETAAKLIEIHIINATPGMTR